jgi:hypothetical protein
LPAISLIELSLQKREHLTDQSAGHGIDSNRQLGASEKLGRLFFQKFPDVAASLGQGCYDFLNIFAEKFSEKMF